MYKLVYALILYIVVMACFVYIKPDVMYDEDKKRYKPFGTGNDATLFPLWLCAIVVAILSYVLVDFFMAWTQSHTTIQPVGELANTADTDEPMVLTPMRRATFGGQNIPHFENQHHAYMPYSNHTQTPNVQQSYGKTTSSNASTAREHHSPHCPLHQPSSSSYVHPRKHKMHIHNSRVWKNMM